MKWLVIVLQLSVVLGFSYADDEQEKVGQVFAQNGVKGTLVLTRPLIDWQVVYNAERAETRFSPASTFKIINALISLESGVVPDTTSIFYHYDGKPMFLESWQADMNLAAAMKVSHLPAFQQLARANGLAIYKTFLNAMNFGNEQVGELVDQFWVNGTLRISAVEWVRILELLQTNLLTFKTVHQAAVRHILVLESGSDWQLFGKTGWSTGLPNEQGVGWFVGWLKREEQVTYFALNIDCAQMEQLPLRQKVVKEVLQALNLLPLK